MAPHCSATLARIIRSIFPTEYIATVEGNTDVAQALLELPFDKIFFTGSATVGRSVMTAAARHLTPVILELGGKSPCLVCADAPIATTARRIVWGKFLNAGQTCTAPDFIMVDRRIRNEFLDAIQTCINEFYGPDPYLSPDYGRIINRRHFDRLRQLIDSGQTVCGGNSHAEDLYIAPTVLTDVAWDSPVMQDEIFGPILPVLPFDSVKDALGILAARPVPLALYLFTRDRAAQERALSQTRSGGVCINDTLTHMLGKHLPFGGLGESGMGAYHGKASFEAFSHQRSVLRRNFTMDPALRYPPPKTSLRMLRQVYQFLMRD